MKTLLFLPLLAFVLSHAEATSLRPKKLPDLVAESDHILIATVTKVEMIDKSGKELTDPEAQTGPDSDNTLRLHLRIKQDGILKTNKKAPPETITIALWQMAILSLGQWKPDEGKEFIFLLKGDHYTWVYPSGFIQLLSKRGEIEQLIRDVTSPSK
jgi:hypothetical protein